MPSKGLENAIKSELPDVEYRLCVKHLHANWSKRFPGKMMKDLMWKAARAANVPYFEYRMQRIKNVSVEAHEALNRIERKKWTRCAFRLEKNCPKLVNNWAEAFNVFIIKARDQSIITMLNNIYHTIMNRIDKECQKKLRRKGVGYERIDEVLRKREEKIFDLFTRPSGSPRCEVTSAKHIFVIDIEKRQCSCGLWQLGRLPCVHSICVYKSRNKDLRQFIHKDYLKSTWLTIYSDFMEPLRGPVF
ncbi:hypothetical protein LIER_41213 [Lithospermum erythrorhizon]|uniref:SWIM-type domain-containing protein n=1 Tax=Lithospermum erythrorhizon TaxID=34254 RepID=A0AAV3R906_LITER